MSTFNYPFWLNKLSDKGFQYCLSLLFPMLHFQYMEEKDVRRIDLCERMFDLAKVNPMYPGYDSGMSYEAYYKALRYYIENFLKSKQETIADQYRNRALAILKAIEEDKTDHSGTDDNLTLFSIYLALSRHLYPNFSPHYIATYVNPLVCKEDAELLIKLRDYQFKTETPGFFKKVEEQSQEAKKLIYMHNVIMYCLLMEAQGEFDEED